ncbi:MAG: sugar ABC transporter substrate-binding protein [Eubacteriales bacterium]|nr:sugar ABC transporter substrate-binding protein [Eubacteriales bacterium]
MRKRLAASLLAASMAVMTVIGGSGVNIVSAAEKAPKSDVTLTLAMCGDGTTKESLDELLGEYTEQTGVKVETIFIASDWGNYCTKIQTMVGGGEDLDCAILAIEGVSKFIGMDIAAPIDDWIEANPELAENVINDTNPEHQKVFQKDGKTYALPFSFNNVLMHFNTDRLEEAGLELPPADWDKEMFLEYCEKLTTEKDGVKQYAVALPYGEYFCTEAWLINNNGAYMNEDFTESTINSPESVEMFQLMQDLIYKYGYAPVPEENVSAIEQLMNGQCAMGSWGRWPTANYIASDFDSVAVQYLPSFKKNQQIFGVDGIFTIASSKHLEEAKDLAGWMSQQDFAGKYLTAGNIPALNSLAQEKIDSLGLPENCEIFYKDSNTTDYKSVSAPPQYTECSYIVTTALSEILVNQADVQETLDQAAEEMNEILEENR